MNELEDLIAIPTPCDKYAGVEPKVRSGFCHACEREIINLSALTRAEALKLLNDEDPHCVGYWRHVGGEVVFADDGGQPGAARLMASGLWRNAAVLTLPMLLAACEPEPAPQQRAVEPLSLEPRLRATGSSAAPSSPGTAEVECDEVPRLGVVKNKVDHVEHRYNETMEPRKPVRLKDALREYELVQGIRQSNVAKRRSFKKVEKTGIIVDTGGREGR